MSSVVSGTRSGEVHHIPEDLGPFHDPDLAGFYPSLRTSCHRCYLQFRSICLQVTEIRRRLPSRKQSGLGPYC